MLHCLLLQELCFNSTAWILKGNLHKREILLTFFSDIRKTPASPFHTFIFRISLLLPEKEQTYEFLKSSGRLCPIRDWIFCIYFFFFWKYIVFGKTDTRLLTTPFLSGCLISDALTVQWDNPLSAPFWVALVKPQIQRDETCRHAVSVSVHYVAQCF